MATVFATVLPFFAIILCGILAGRRELLTGDAVRALNAFVFYFALPARFPTGPGSTPREASSDFYPARARCVPVLASSRSQWSVA